MNTVDEILDFAIEREAEAAAFYEDLPGIKSAVFDQLVEDGYYRRRPDRVQGAWIAGGIFAGGGLAVLGIAAANNWGMSVLTVIMAAVLSAIVIIGFGLLMPARTVRGARTQEAILGFEEFLARVESDRFRRMITGPEMFERFVLPDLAACCDRLDHAFYHLDGKGELPHLDLLLSIDGLRGIQWIPGAGQPPPICFPRDPQNPTYPIIHFLTFIPPTRAQISGSGLHNMNAYPWCLPGPCDRPPGLLHTCR